MTKRIASLTSTIVLALGVAAFTGSALAGNGNRNGKADTQTVSANGSASQVAAGNSAGAHGNSTNAAGQIKQDSVSTQASGGGSADQNAGAEAGANPTSATGAIGSRTLPFTGFPIWIVVLVALALIAVGMTLRRRSSAPSS
ncbi:MAG: hypothetical protein M3O92_06755 [Actinomycetota bacterium]|nr:hypothetical protein [Actinomycetota bacterium]